MFQRDENKCVCTVKKKEVEMKFCIYTLIYKIHTFFWTPNYSTPLFNTSYGGHVSPSVYIYLYLG